ncbi:MAG TPA: hypothetical protein PK858_07050, partial [Saprospiraceae bacterium]|nr:hypothetical protein [Saprospiraceae bacterium]
MTNFTRYLLVPLLALMGWASAQAQALTTSFQNPDGLYVCGTDQMTVTLTNIVGTAVTGIRTTIALPAGIAYVAG